MNKIIDIVKGNNLIHEGTPDQGNYGIAPYTVYDGSGNFSHNKGAVLRGINGLTAGGWFNMPFPDTLMGVWQFPTNQCWRLYVSSSIPSFSVSSIGSDTITISGSTWSTTQWNFIVGKFDPANSELAIFVNGTKFSNFLAPSSLFNSTAGFAIGGDVFGNNLSIGKASNCFVSQAPVLDSQIVLLYQISRNLYGR